MGISIEQLSETRQSILLTIKKEGLTTIAKLFDQLSMTKESIRQQLVLLEAEGFVKRITKKQTNFWGGRPSKHYSLTIDGEHLFPKEYDSLTVEVIDNISEELGPDVLNKILATMTNARVKEWKPRLEGLSLEERLEALKDIYLKDDPYMSVEKVDNKLNLIENNCPFLNVAEKRPMLCSVTVSTLSQLLGFEVKREKKFQNGDGRCVFQVQLDKPIEKNYTFKLEE